MPGSDDVGALAAETEPALVSTIPPPLDGDLAPGTRVSRYVVLRKLAQGGMGVIYMAYDQQLDRRVALKLLAEEGAGTSGSEGGERLLREAQAMAKLSHPNVVAVFDIGKLGDQVFLAMEYADGTTLRAWRDAAPRTTREVLAIYLQAGRGLEAAHAEGILHRDFKPDNVVVDGRGRARVLDFGLARIDATSAPLDEVALAATVSSPDVSSSTLTRVGALVGTPGYMAPEQIRGERAEARSDQFAFCVALYEALHGERPYTGKTMREIHDAIVAGNLRAPPKGTSVPRGVRATLARGLRAKPDDRFPTMRELLAELGRDPAALRRRWLGAVAVVGAGCAIAGGVRAVNQRHERACHVMADRLGGVWDAPRKEAIARAFHATGLVYADDTWKRVEPALDAYAGSWVASMEAACTATRVRKDASEAVLDLRSTCLDERLDSLKALGDVLAAPDRSVVGSAVRSSRELPPLRPCSDVDRLSEATQLPPAPEARAEIRELTAEVVAASAVNDAGKHAESLERLQRIEDRVKAARYGRLLVLWWGGVARAQAVRESKAAMEPVLQWLDLAETYHLDSEKARAEIALGGLLGRTAHFPEAHRAFRLAAATIARLGGDPQLEVRRDLGEGDALIMEGKRREALEVFHGAQHLIEAEGVEAPWIEEKTHSALAHEAEASGRLDEAIEERKRAVSIAEGAYGPLSPMVANLTNNLAFTELGAGRYDDAHVTVSRAIQMFEVEIEHGEISRNEVVPVAAIHTRGEVFLRQGRAQEAADELVRACDLYKPNEAGDTYRALAESELAAAWRSLGRADDERRAIDEANAIEGKISVPPEIVAGTLVAQAELAIDQRRSADAISLAERAVESLETIEGGLYELADARLVLARALTLGHRELARARGLAEQARDGFAKLRDQKRIDEAAGVIERTGTVEASR